MAIIQIPRMNLAFMKLKFGGEMPIQPPLLTLILREIHGMNQGLTAWNGDEHSSGD